MIVSLCCYLSEEERIKEIAEAAGVDTAVGLKEIKNLADVALAHKKRGASEREAWARASFDFPEWSKARELVSLFLGFTEATTEVERTLKQVPLQERKDRAAMLDTTLEHLLLSSQAPSTDAMCTRVKNTVGDFVLKPTLDFLPDILKRYHAKFALKLARGPRKKRRDAGIKKSRALLEQNRKGRGQPSTEAAAWPKNNMKS